MRNRSLPHIHGCRQLLAFSAATLDRMLKPYDLKIGGVACAQTNPANCCATISHIEADTVAYCGDSSAGDFVYSLTFIETAPEDHSIDVGTSPRSSLDSATIRHIKRTRTTFCFLSRSGLPLLHYAAHRILRLDTADRDKVGGVLLRRSYARGDGGEPAS